MCGTNSTVSYSAPLPIGLVPYPPEFHPRWNLVEGVVLGQAFDSFQDLVACGRFVGGSLLSEPPYQCLPSPQWSVGFVMTLQELFTQLDPRAFLQTDVQETIHASE